MSIPPFLIMVTKRGKRLRPCEWTPSWLESAKEPGAEEGAVACESELLE
jgi:hypothetical protein